ncbi:N-acetyltransferase family protein [Hwanghaeella sp.]|uniref:GNAT family N-acetyltransferase n=1 Tax=Hwanghaeella sp. TaxID=2605943 RepID=UPI003CCBDEB1
MTPTMLIRTATAEDLPALVTMLADDILGQQREDASLPLNQAYKDAFDAIEADPYNDIIVGEIDGTVMAMMQFTVIPSISFKGRSRAQIESVRVAADYRGHGYGRQMFQWAIEEGRRRNCHLAQLSTNAARKDAARFYEDLGFTASHVGMKRVL